MKYGFDASSYKNNFSTTFQNNHVKSENLRRVGCVAGWWRREFIQNFSRREENILKT